MSKKGILLHVQVYANLLTFGASNIPFLQLSLRLHLAYLTYPG